MSRPIVSATQSQIIQWQEKRKHLSLCCVPSHVDVSGNERADKGAKSAAADDYLIYRKAVLYKDMRAHVKKNIKLKWQKD